MPRPRPQARSAASIPAGKAQFSRTRNRHRSTLAGAADIPSPFLAPSSRVVPQPDSPGGQLLSRVASPVQRVLATGWVLVARLVQFPRSRGQLEVFHASPSLARLRLKCNPLRAAVQPLRRPPNLSRASRRPSRRPHSCTARTRA